MKNDEFVQEEKTEVETLAEEDENFAVVARCWEYLPFWLKAKILLMCMFYAWRNRLWQRLGLPV